MGFLLAPAGPHPELGVGIQVLIFSVQQQDLLSIPSHLASPGLKAPDPSMAVIRRNLGLPPAIEISGRLGVVRGSRALTFPKARSTESKYRNTPKRMKKMPKPVVPTPISATDKEAVMGQALGRGWGQVPFGGGQ